MATGGRPGVAGPDGTSDGVEVGGEVASEEAVLQGLNRGLKSKMSNGDDGLGGSRGGGGRVSSR